MRQRKTKAAPPAASTTAGESSRAMLVFLWRGMYQWPISLSDQLTSHEYDGLQRWDSKWHTLVPFMMKNEIPTLREIDETPKGRKRKQEELLESGSEEQEHSSTSKKRRIWAAASSLPVTVRSQTPLSFYQGNENSELFIRQKCFIFLMKLCMIITRSSLKSRINFVLFKSVSRISR